MSGMNALLEAIAVAERNGDEAVLATVVKVEGSAYRRPGARLLIPLYGSRVGSISGGCLEADVAKKAWWLTDSGAPVLRRYSTGASEDEDDQDAALTFGLGCNGTVYVLLERHGGTRRATVVELLRQVRDRQLPGVAATVISTYRRASVQVGERLLLTPDGSVSGALCQPHLDAQVRRDLVVALAQQQSALRVYSEPRGEVEVFFEFVAPPRRLLVFGAGHDAQPLVRLAKLLEWQVTVLDGRAHYARAERFPEADAVMLAEAPRASALQALMDGAAVVVMTHSYSQDRQWLGVALQGAPSYIGQLGPRERTERLLAEISAPATALPALATLHYPVGLDLGGDTPECVAMAILAEITAALNCRSGGMLQRRAAPIHPPERVIHQRLATPSPAE
ncbi:XdhC family protein [Pseudomonas sp. CrR25]|nr:XdhC family protein [Pseudomonas sp. CrR25]